MTHFTQWTFGLTLLNSIILLLFLTAAIVAAIKVNQTLQRLRHTGQTAVQFGERIVENLFLPGQRRNGEEQQ